MKTQLQRQFTSSSVYKRKPVQTPKTVPSAEAVFGWVLRGVKGERCVWVVEGRVGCGWVVEGRVGCRWVVEGRVGAGGLLKGGEGCGRVVSGSR